VAQDAFAQLWRHRETLDWDRPVVPWLMVTARRLATDRFRRVRRLLIGPPRPSTLEEVTVGRWLDLQQAMTVLSPLERTSLVLTLVEGHDYAQVATILKTSPGAVRSAVSRAREKLEAVR
jgi:RNA polymerase sigma factor (sigma-70 family)